MTSPAFTASPSLNRTSRIRPVVLGATAESSPSIRPLNKTRLSGTGGEEKNAFQMPKAAPASASNTMSTTITRRARRGFGGDGTACGCGRGLVSAGGCSTCGICCAFMMSLAPDFYLLARASPFFGLWFFDTPRPASSVPFWDECQLLSANCPILRCRPEVTKSSLEPCVQVVVTLHGPEQQSPDHVALKCHGQVG